MVKLVCGVGYNDRSCPSSSEGKPLKEYRLWEGMLQRCYSELTFFNFPNYVGCSLSDNFKKYSFFHFWCQSQIGFGREDFELDKDLLNKGNRVYSECSCVFIPRALNTLLSSSNRSRGAFPIGVSWGRGVYRSELRVFNKKIHLGCFRTPEEAFQAYKTAKEAHIKDMAELYKADIDPRAYAALMAYQVEITD